MKVSIICTNFNKGKWIGEAIESFLKQETTFPYEILMMHLLMNLLKLLKIMKRSFQL